MTDTSVSRVPFNRIEQLSKTDRDYATDPGSFVDFITAVPSIEAFAEVIHHRSAYKTDRQTLVDVLTEQYGTLDVPSDHLQQLLQENHFCVTTAHQPALLTGPLYFIYKVCSTIHLSRSLNNRYPEVVVHPVLVLGGEDHDFAEINHLNLFGKTISWDTEASGAVGRLSTKSLADTLAEVREVLGTSPFSDEMKALIDASFREEFDYGQAMQKFVLGLFRDTDLIVIQLDNAKLKSAFGHIVKDELLHQTSQELITASQKQIEALGYKPQAYIRDINLFYLRDGLRARIVQENDQYAVLDTDYTFTKDEMSRELREYPERFSPNVNLRPLFQETVLPNLAYIGGGGELAYWLERKKQFDHYDVPFPLLIRRNSVLFIDAGSAKLMDKLDISLSDLFGNPDKCIADWIRRHAEHEVEIEREYKMIEEGLEGVVSKASDIDPTVARKVEAFKVKTLKDVEHLGKRLIREEKARNDNAVQKIRKVFDRLFPEGGLQERHDNFMQFYIRHGKDYLNMLIHQLDPLEPGFIVLRAPFK